MLALEIIERQSRLVAEFFKKELKNELEQQGHRDTGKLIDSIEYEILTDTDTIKIVFTYLYYGDIFETGGGDQSIDGTLEESSFKYTKEVLDGNQAVLEFETQIDGKYVNGVDIITFNDEGKIIEFKVMIRPLQAVNIIHEKMQDMLKQLK